MRKSLLIAALLLLAPANHAAAQAPQRLAKFRDFIQHLQWSPDGKQFLFTRVPPGKMGVWTMNADGGDLKPILPKEPMPHFDGHWSPDGKRIVFVFDRLQGTDGKLQIDVIDADGNHKTLLPHKAFDEAPRWSPDGKRIAWCSTRDKNQDIWTCDTGGKDLKRLTSDPGADNAPAWSPDGKQIAFTSGRAGNLDIWVMNADGSDQRNLTASSSKMDYWPSWSPDGKHIAFTSNRDGNYEIYVMDAGGANPRNLSNHPGVDNFATWGPDGRLAWISNRAGTYDVLAVDPNRLR